MIEFRAAAVTVESPDAPADAVGADNSAAGNRFTTILQPTTLTLAEQRISIIGSNGSGKSTLARLINGLIEPSSGSVHVTAPTQPQARRAESSTAARARADSQTRTEHGSEARAGSGAVAGTVAHAVTGTVAHATPRGGVLGADQRTLNTVRDGAAVRRAVGFVFSNPDAQLIMPTVIEDVELSLRRSHKDKLARKAAALDALTQSGIDHLAAQSAHTLSGGQKQLLAITSVLAADPSIIVADEPTTLLDLRNAALIGDLLMSLTQQQVVVVTHDLDLAARADRTLVIDQGAVVYDGQPQAAIAHYRELASQPMPLREHQ